MKTDFTNNERFADVDDPQDAPVRRTYRILFGRRIHRSTLLIGLMFVLGAGWIFWESRTIGPKSVIADSLTDDPNITLNLDQMKMDAVIGETREMRKEQMFGALLKDAQRRHIRLCELPRDPFEPFGKKEPPPNTLKVQPTTAPVVEDPPPDVSHLELRSILIGAIPTAIINGYLIQKGQVIDGWTVAEIQPTKVVLQWRNRKHVLTMP